MKFLTLVLAGNILASPLLQQPLFTATSKRLISTSPSHHEWLSEAQIMELIRKRQKFIDITDGDLQEIQELARSPVSPHIFPSNVQHKNETETMLHYIDTDRMKDWLTSLSSFKTRYYKSKSGQDSAQWIFDQTKALSEKTTDKVRLSVSKFKHSWQQFSVIARLEPVDASPDAEIVVLSAHQDSVNQWNPWFGRSPGADDDGSGSCTIFEALTVFVETGFVPSNRVLEFHWYSAEEGG
ncbi:Leucine aminopeptidase 1 [Kappamyces sp. JEL0680]|nr:Leucine aminopeptidase 1 [Kappamyces sp. JEL0680]